VARTVYLGSAPTITAANRGIEDRRIKLGCVMPGESPAVFGDALRRLSAAATYLYQDGPRYWYSTQPTVTKLADDRAEQLKRNPDAVAQELDTRLRANLRQTGDFGRVHPLPQSGQDVADDTDARLVVLGLDHPYRREPGNPAELAAKAILASRGSTPRLFQNTLVFLAVDQTRLQDLDEAVRRYLAWESILTEQGLLDLSPHQVRQAETQKTSADSTVTARLPEAYQWLLVPVQSSPQAAVEWQGFRLTGQEALAVRASKKLRNDELLVTSLAGTRLRMELDRVPLWRGEHVAIKQLAADFASYLYLPRLADPAVLINAICGGLALLTWEQDAFAYGESYDEAAARYRGLRCGQNVSILDEDAPGLLVKPDVARRQLDGETPPGPDGTGTTTERGGIAAGGTTTGAGGTDTTTHPGPSPAPMPRRFHGSVALDATRVGRDASRIAEEVIAHIVALTGAQVRVTLEIEATVPDGAPEHVVRIVTENSRTLRFTSHGFEVE
jgi:nucleotide-binding universal stress UspA family protein